MGKGLGTNSAQINRRNRNGGKYRQIVFTFLATSFFISCSSKNFRVDRPLDSSQANTSDLVIIATTDFHGAFDHADGFAAKVRELRRIYGPKSLLVNAGDLFQGSMEANDSKGAAVIDYFNALGFDLVALGNHDFDYGPKRLGSVFPQKGEHPRGNLFYQIKKSKFKWISTNVIETKPDPFNENASKNALSQRTMLWPHWEKTIPANSKKACFVGATTIHTPTILTTKKFVENLSFQPLLETTRAQAQFLREKQNCDFVILLAHAGVKCSDIHNCEEPGDAQEIKPLLEALPKGTFDAAVVGHTHTRAATTIAGTPVVEANAHGRSVATIHLKHKPGQGSQLVGIEFFDIEADKPNQTTQNDIAAILEPYRRKTEKRKALIVGKLSAPFPHDHNSENALTNAIADSIYSALPNVDLAIVNGGGVRRPLNQLNVTYGDVYSMLPFENYLTRVEQVPGKLVRRLLAIASSGAHGTPGLSGARLRMRPTETKMQSIEQDIDGDGKSDQWEHDNIESVEILSSRGNGAAKQWVPLNDNKFYTIASINYLVDGGDHQKVVYDLISSRNKRTFPDALLRDVFVKFLKRYPAGLNPEDFFNAQDSTKRRIQWIPYSKK